MSIAELDECLERLFDERARSDALSCGKVDACESEQAVGDVVPVLGAFERSSRELVVFARFAE